MPAAAASYGTATSTASMQQILTTWVARLASIGTGSAPAWRNGSATSNPISGIADARDARDARVVRTVVTMDNPVCISVPLIGQDNETQLIGALLFVIDRFKSGSPFEGVDNKGVARSVRYLADRFAGNENGEPNG